MNRDTNTIDSREGIESSGGRRAEPNITVVTACRNSAKTVGKAIESIIDQHYSNVEHVIIDANSDDGTADVIAGFGDNVSWWIREPDDGIADAWNKGIRNATGEIIGILNADDFYTPGTFAAVVEAFERNPDCGFVFGDLKMVNGVADGWYTVFGRPDYERITKYHMLGVPHPTVFVRRKVYDELGLFNTSYAICPDYEFIRRMTSHGVKGHYIPRVLAVMREGGVSERKRIEALREVLNISTRYGCNALLARIFFYAKCLRFCIGRSLTYVGLSLSTQRRLVHSVFVRRKGSAVSVH